MTVKKVPETTFALVKKWSETVPSTFARTLYLSVMFGCGEKELSLSVMVAVSAVLLKRKPLFTGAVKGLFVIVTEYSDPVLYSTVGVQL